MILLPLQLSQKFHKLLTEVKTCSHIVRRNIQLLTTSKPTRWCDCLVRTWWFTSAMISLAKKTDSERVPKLSRNAFGDFTPRKMPTPGLLLTITQAQFTSAYRQNSGGHLVGCALVKRCRWMPSSVAKPDDSARSQNVSGKAQNVVSQMWDWLVNRDPYNGLLWSLYNWV